MVEFKDALAAKQLLSSRLLRDSLAAGVVGMSRTILVSAAVARASRNVHAIGVGRKAVQGKATLEPCVRLYVIQKLPKSLLSPRDILPESVNGVPTDVIESAPAFTLARKRPSKSKPADAKVAATSASPCTTRRRERQRPIVGGISAAHHDITAGTIACLCRSTQVGDDPDDVFVLSNNHVFAAVNLGATGDDLYQPGPADGGSSGDHFADLHRYVPIQVGQSSNNSVDAAIGRLLLGVEYEIEVCSIGAVIGTARAEEDMEVRKHGRTTGYTEGFVSNVSYDALVGMDPANPSVVALFTDQMRIEATPPHAAIGLGGDSGSLVFERGANRAVGLYFAGPVSGAYGIANHIDEVVDRLNIQLL